MKYIKKLNKIEYSSDTMNFILCITMVFLCVGIIHPYLFNSYIAFAIIISLYSISKNKLAVNTLGEKSRKEK